MIKTKLNNLLCKMLVMRTMGDNVLVKLRSIGRAVGLRVKSTSLHYSSVQPVLPVLSPMNYPHSSLFLI